MTGRAPVVVHTDRGRAHLAVPLTRQGYATACGRVMASSTVTAWKRRAPWAWMRYPRCARCEQRADRAPDWPSLVRSASW